MKPAERKLSHVKAARDEFEIRIEKLVYGGDGLGRAFGKVVFVPFAAPGDLLLVRAVEEKKNYIRAHISRVLESGAGRCQPMCPYFGSCGGCQWQHLEYAHQLETKESILRELLHHRFPETEQLSIKMVASPASYGYRSRARVQVRGQGQDRRTGFFKFRSHDVEDIQMCPLLRPTLNRALAEVRAREQSPGSENSEIEIACSEEEGNWASVRGEIENAAPLLSRRIGDFTYMTSPSVFFQANDLLTTDLVATVGDFSSEGETRAALDLFCGIGLFSLPLARRYDAVTAVEASSQACELCSRNAAVADLANVRVVCADVHRWLSAVGMVSPPGFDLVVLDPPRAGAGTEVMSRLREWAPETLIYVSCDPQTLVRDLLELPARDYRIDAVRGFDMFPQTYHFETVVKLARR